MMRIAVRKYLFITMWISLLLMGGCTSSWKAPVYTHAPAKSKATHYGSQYNKPAFKPADSRYFRVGQGDTLYAIAWRTGTDFANLAAWNHLKPPYTIYPGQQLLVKPPVKTAATVKKKAVKKSPSKTTVKPSKATAKKITTTPQKPEKFKSRLNWRWPTTGKITKGFKYRDDTRKGVTLSGKTGQSVKAAEEGKVVYSGSGLIGYGKLIIIKHNKNYLSAYGFNQKILVNEGQWVAKGKTIAMMGTDDTGVPALHFEIRKNGNPVNPVTVLPKRN